MSAGERDPARAIVGIVVLAAVLVVTGRREAGSLALALVGGAAALAGLRAASSRLRRTAGSMPALLALAFGLLYALDPAPSSARLGWIVLGLVCAALALLLGGRARFVTGALVACTSLALGLAVGEGWAGARWPRVPHGLVALEGSPAARPYRPDPELGQRFEPGFRGRFTHPEYAGERVEINSDGFRDLEWPSVASKQEQELRVLVLGDSTTLGFGVQREESIPALLGEELQRLFPERTVRAFNAGVPGYGARHAQRLLLELGERLAPDLVVVLFYDGNDLEDARAQFELGRQPGASVRHTGGDDAAVPRGDPSLFTLEYWRRYSILWDRIELGWAQRSRDRGRHAPGHAFGAPILEAMRIEPGPDVRQELEWTVEALFAMAEHCRARGAELLVGRIPARVQVERAAFEALLERRNARAADHDPALPGRAVLARCAQAGIPVVDLLHPLVPSGPEVSTYFLEGHPNRLGNRLAAEALARAAVEWLQSPR